MNVFERFNRRTMLAIAAAVAVALIGFVATKTIANARDCDANAVLRCGAYSKEELVNKINSGDGAHSSANLKQIYYSENRNITETGDQSIMSASTVEGVVTKEGKVIVGGQVVAENVWSSGRQFIQNSQRDGSIWMRPPAVSFRSSQLPAFVNMAGGQFRWAIIKSCGNPVRRIDKPFGVIYKHVIDTAQPGTSYAADDEAHALPVAQNATIKYEITVSNGGFAPMTNVVINDTLPEGVELISDPTKRHITANLGTIQPGQLKHFTIGLTQGVRVKATQGFVTNKACFTANDNQSGCDTAVIKLKTNVTAQSFDCTGLEVEQVGGRDSLKYKFTATADVQNTNVTGYLWDFGDGTTRETTTDNVEYEYKQRREVTASVRIKTAAGTEENADAECKKTFKAGGDEQEQAFDCTGLMVEQVGGAGSLNYKFTATSSFQNTNIVAYHWDFGDGTTDKTVTNQTTASTTHTYATKRDVTASVRVESAIGTEQAPDTECQKTFTAGGGEVPTPTGGGGELPQAGIEGAAAGALGTGALGYSLRAYVRSRRSLLDALLGKE